MSSEWWFTLPINRAARVEASDSWGDISVRSSIGQDSIIVEGVVADSAEAGLGAAIESGNRFLSALSFYHDEAYNLAYKTVGWRATRLSNGTTTSATSIAATITLVENVEASTRVIIEKRGPDGSVLATVNTARPGELPEERTETMHFFRRGSTASDSFDAARNYLLVIESVARRIAKRDALKSASGKQRPTETETIEHGLESAFSGNVTRLHSVTASDPDLSSSPGFSDVAAYLYRRVRCELCHAGGADPIKVPYNARNETEVKRAVPLARAVAREMIRYEIAQSL